MKNNFKVGDWVVLGRGGSGWAPDLEGEICKIKKIGDFSNRFHYDIILDDMSNFKLIGLQCSGKNIFKNVIGCSSSNMRYATQSEIEKHCKKNGIFYKEEIEESNMEDWYEE